MIAAVPSCNLRFPTHIGSNMSGLTRLIHEIHRRSLWQVLARQRVGGPGGEE